MTNMNPIIIELVNRYYMLDWMTRASQTQNYLQIKNQRPKRNTIFCRFITWLGEKMVIVGVRLLERYGEFSPANNHRTLLPGEN